VTSRHPSSPVVTGGEFRPLVTLALPIVQAEIGWMAMGIVDTFMVQPLGPAAIGAVGMGSILYLAVMVVGMGTLLALDTFVSQNYGAGRVDECHRWLFAGLQLAGSLTIILTLLAWGLVELLPAFDLHPDVLALLRPYMTHLLWSTPALLAYSVFRRYLQAMHIVRPVMYALVAANLVNLLLNWLLVEGHWGFPALGVVGSAWATVFARIAMAVYLFGVIVSRARVHGSGLRDVPFTFDAVRQWAIVRLGLPAAGQMLLEVGVFAAASTLAGRITPAAVAAHNIVLNIIGLIFMVPFGLSSAAAVRVGHAVGRGDPHGARAAGWLAVGLATVAMTGSAMLFALAPSWLMRPFTGDAEVIQIGAGLFLVAAVFQLFDGMQAVTTGALRGLGETRIPMIANLVGHWLIGLPLAYALSLFYAAQGLWMGLAVGIILIGGVLLGVWHKRSKAIIETAYGGL
jgi:MATE family multidrug resistance protein